MTTNRKVLLVDDDETLRTSLAEQLGLHEDFTTIDVGTGADALAAVKENFFDCIILDVGLPDMDGRDLCRLMRRNNVRSPIIMLTGVDSDSDAILGLDSGANDYVTKPFRLGVLLARIRAQLRQFEQSEDAVFTIGPYSFQPSAKLLIDEAANKKIRLTEKETAILKYLYRIGSKVVGRDTLLGEVWGYNAGCHDPHAGNPCLSPAPEDRAGSVERANPGDGARRLPPCDLVTLSARPPSTLLRSVR